jgi:hypothetical protein
MTADQWAAFLLDYKGPVGADLTGYVRWVDGKIAELKGTPSAAGDPNTPYFADDIDLATVSQAMDDTEMARLEKLIGADKETQRRYKALSGNIATETAALQTLTDKLKDAQGAKARTRELQTEREEAYGRAFDALVAEQAVLKELYAPLMARLAAASGTLAGLSFSVARIANVEQWAWPKTSSSSCAGGRVSRQGHVAGEGRRALEDRVGNGRFNRDPRGHGGVPPALSEGPSGSFAHCAYRPGRVPAVVEAVRSVAVQHRPHLDPLWHRL